MDFLLWPGTSVSELIKDEMHLILRQTVEVSLDEDTPESSLSLIGGDAFLIVYVKERRFFFFLMDAADITQSNWTPFFP
jgi:hypothetical protein